MKLISPNINPIQLNVINYSELESESYRSSNVLECQHYDRDDYLQFIVYFEVGSATYLRVNTANKYFGDDIEFNNSVEQSFSNEYYFGKRRFGKGYLVFRAKISNIVTSETNFKIYINLVNTVNGLNCILASNNIEVKSGGKLIKYSNTYDTADCNYSYLKGLFE